MPQSIRDVLTSAAGELDLVRSGLDDTMRNAYNEIKETLARRPEAEDMRTAAYMLAIEKISRAYLEHGVWP